MKKRPPIAQGVRFNVLRRDNFTCRYCGRSSPAVTLHIDHVVPVHAGGVDAESNLITACQDGNLGKSGKEGVTPPVRDGAPQPSADTGFLGMFGHSFNDRGEICWQFHVARKVSDGAYALQLFSWMDGAPTDIVIRPENDLTFGAYKFYPTREAWLAAEEKQSCREDRHAQP